MTLEELDSYQRTNGKSKNWIRVGLDTGGIAAGGKEVLASLREEKDDAGYEVDIRSCGSCGLSFADPTVEVQVEGMPTMLYGAVDAKTAPLILREHIGKGHLLDDHVMATRKRATSLDGEKQTAVLVMDTCVVGGDKTKFFQASFEQELKVHGFGDEIRVYRAFDMGLYDRGLCAQLFPSGVTFSNVLSPDIRRIIKDCLVEGKIVEDLLESESDPQARVVLRNCGKIDPDSLEDSLRNGGYRGLRRALTEMTPEQVIEEMKASGLRGRGGAGFPTWLKWKLTRDPESQRKYVICNADEGDPGAFMDRSVLESDPHSVLEGLMIAAYAIGASKGYFYIRAEYPLAVERVRQAIEQAREAGLLGRKVLGTDFCFEAAVRLGAGAFVCGEETALIASIEGKRGSPSPRPPYPSVKGLWGMPTSINNVETLACVSAICNRGAEAFARYGTEDSPGTKVFAVTGKVRHAQLVEIPMGYPIRSVIFDICGGVLDGEDIKGVQTGGPSGGVIPEKHLDAPISYESLRELGSIMGSGGMLVMDERDSMVDVAKFYLRFCVDESCGKCAPCRIGGYQMLQIIEKIYRGRGEESDLSQLRHICSAMKSASLCGLGQTAPNPVLSTLRYFEHEYMAFIEGGHAYARKIRQQQKEQEKVAS